VLRHLEALPERLTTFGIRKAVEQRGGEDQMIPHRFGRVLLLGVAALFLCVACGGDADVVSLEPPAGDSQQSVLESTSSMMLKLTDEARQEFHERLPHREGEFSQALLLVHLMPRLRTDGYNPWIAAQVMNELLSIGREGMVEALREYLLICAELKAPALTAESSFDESRAAAVFILASSSSVSLDEFPYQWWPIVPSSEADDDAVYRFPFVIANGMPFLVTTAAPRWGASTPLRYVLEEAFVDFNVREDQFRGSGDIEGVEDAVVATLSAHAELVFGWTTEQLDKYARQVVGAQSAAISALSAAGT